MKPIVKTRLSSATTLVIPLQPGLDSKANRSLTPLLLELDNLLLTSLRRWSITALRLALGSVFLWFGALKIFGNSPVTSLIRETYTFLPVGIFIFILGVWEVFIGIGIILKRVLRCVLVLLCLHLVGTFTAVWFKPSLFFAQGFPFGLTIDGEFVIKNLVLIAAALVIAGYEVTPLTRS